MVKVSLVRPLGGQLQFVHQFSPVLHHRRAILAFGAQSGEVIHDRQSATAFLGCLERVSQDDASVSAAALGAGYVEEALHEHSINAVVPHPAEMQLHRALVPGTEHARWCSVAVMEQSGVGLDRKSTRLN